ncbi:hypothetical protein ASD21_17690 [Caulobacter sp. Root1455]|uniref:hypothetical protein n=1 Tax=unclassified Caulobacter TaxID=2648921 RepID=UPI0006F6CA88|nr:MULTISPECIES: hypothetical protein [unclassified Caulobacter]KQY26538.1 hypothetical protein ASD38_20100 [Caulobacter sp. Root487D2Y]KQY91512.1 hypothetical protein ASD21_17690 [Caulobacter sp. Root1455]
MRRDYEEALDKALEFVRTTVVGGALFLLPIVFVVFVVSKVVGLMRHVTEPLVESLGVTTVAGVAASTIVTVIGLILSAFLVGLIARTRMGQSFLTWIQSGVAAALPQFSLIQDMAKNLGTEGAAEMPIVLVPTDAGWALGLLIEAPVGDWHAVYLPGAPQMGSGSIAYAHTDQVHRTDLTINQLWVILRRRGMGSAKVYEHLAKLPPQDGG